MPKAKKQEEEQDTFSDIISAIDAMEMEPDRHLSIQIDQSLREAVRAVQNGGKAATVSLTFKVARAPESTKRIQISATLKKTMPPPPVSAVSLYADEDGSVHRSNPAQEQLPEPIGFPRLTNAQSQEG